MRVRQRTHALRVIWAPSLARRALRHRAVHVGVVVVIGLAVGMSMVSKFDELEQQRAEWGTVEVVLVVTAQVEPGELVAESVEQREIPRAVVSADAVDAVAPGSRAKVTLFPGEVVLRQRVTNSSGASGQSSATPSGTVALTVPVVRLVPFLATGDLVDLWATDSANFSSHRVAANVVVLAFADDDITIAVPEDAVGGVAAASLRPLTITLVG